MQGDSGSQSDLWDVSSVAEHLLHAGSGFSFLPEHRFDLFPPEMFTELATPNPAPCTAAA